MNDKLLQENLTTEYIAQISVLNFAQGHRIIQFSAVTPSNRSLQGRCPVGGTKVTSMHTLGGSLYTCMLN